MIVETPALDYLTLTTFDEITWSKWIALYRGPDKEPGKMMQYVGWRGDGVFFGSGTQKGKPHFMLRLSGESAEALHEKHLIHDAICTRIDIQLTLRLPKGYKARAFCDDLRGALLAGNCPPHVQLIENEDGLDTVYTGSRTSLRFIRFYVKEDDTGARWLRAEVELKSDLARSAWARIRHGDESGAILKSELGRLPRHLPLVRMFIGSIADKESRISAAARRRAEPSRTLRWIEKSAVPAIKRLLNDHDHGDKMRHVLSELAKYAEIGEKTPIE